MKKNDVVPIFSLGNDYLGGKELLIRFTMRVFRIFFLISGLLSHLVLRAA